MTLKQGLDQIHVERLARIKVGAVMVEPENKMFCQSDVEKELAVEQRFKALSDLGLLEAQTVPVFEEATQTAAHLLEIPICILGFIERDYYCFKSAVGLSQLGLMNQLAQTRQLPRNEAICTQVVESHQVLAINDTLSDPAFAKSILVQRYGIRAYLGVPLFNAAGLCLGAIAVMDLEPRSFTIQQIKLLELIARWSMSEFERNRLLQKRGIESREDRRNEFTLTKLPTTPNLSSTPSQEPPALIQQAKLELLEQLTQELRTPLTSVLGMANVVCREIYGPLTSKQKEYLEIIQNSGRHLLSLVNEISQLGTIKDYTQALNLTSVDIEMLCQQVINALEEVAKRREQQIRLSLEPGRSRIWVLDKDKVRQLLYHLLSGIIKAATTGSIIRIHISHKGEGLNLSVSISHPWLGEGLAPVDPQQFQILSSVTSPQLEVAPNHNHTLKSETLLSSLIQDKSSGLSIASKDTPDSAQVQANSRNRSYEYLRLLLSQELAELHGGNFCLQGAPESGYRYVVSLPELTTVEVNL